MWVAAAGGFVVFIQNRNQGDRNLNTGRKQWRSVVHHGMAR